MKGTIGEISRIAVNFPSCSWLFNIRHVMTIAQSPATFALISTNYWVYRNTTFKLPYLRGRISVDCANGSVLLVVVLGQMAGIPNITFSKENMQKLKLSVNSSNDAILLGSPTGYSFGAIAEDG